MQKRADWKELHLRAASYKGKNDMMFLHDFANRIVNSSTCDCKNKFKKWMHRNPPQFGGDKYFEWTIAAHNSVNKDLGLKPLPINEAKQMYFGHYNRIR